MTDVLSAAAETAAWSGPRIWVDQPSTGMMSGPRFASEPLDAAPAVEQRVFVERPPGERSFIKPRAATPSAPAPRRRRVAVGSAGQWLGGN